MDDKLTLGLTADGDMRFENGDFVIVSGKEEIAQCIEIDFGTQLSEWFLNELNGADKQRLLGKSTEDDARSEAIRILGQEERIERIETVTVADDKQKRKRQIYYLVTLVNGEQLEGEVNM